MQVINSARNCQVKLSNDECVDILQCMQYTCAPPAGNNHNYIPCQNLDRFQYPQPQNNCNMESSPPPSPKNSTFCWILRSHGNDSNGSHLLQSLLCRTTYDAWLKLQDDQCFMGISFAALGNVKGYIMNQFICSDIVLAENFKAKRKKTTDTWLWKERNKDPTQLLKF